MSNSISSIRSRQFLGDDERNLQTPSSNSTAKTDASKTTGDAEPTRSHASRPTEMTAGRTYAAAEQQRAKDPAFHRFLDTSMREQLQHAADGLAATTKPLGVSLTEAQRKQLAGDLQKLAGSLAQLGKDLGAAAGPLASHPAVRGMAKAHIDYSFAMLSAGMSLESRSAVQIGRAVIKLVPKLHAEIRALQTLATACKEDPALRKTLAPLQADIQRVSQDAEKVAADLSSLR